MLDASFQFPTALLAHRRMIFSTARKADLSTSFPQKALRFRPAQAIRDMAEVHSANNGRTWLSAFMGKKRSTAS